MTCFYEITGHLTPTADCIAAVERVLDMYRVEYVDPAPDGDMPIRFADYAGWHLQDDLLRDLEPLVSAGRINIQTNQVNVGANGDDDFCDCACVFENGAWVESQASTFRYYPGVDDPAVFARKLPDEVLKAAAELVKRSDDKYRVYYGSKHSRIFKAEAEKEGK